jgi:hypothetical protein
MFPASRLEAVLGFIDPRRDHAAGAPRRSLRLALAAAALCAALVWAGDRWQARLVSATGAVSLTGAISSELAQGGPNADLHPLVVLLKLSSAALIGLLVTAVHRGERDRPVSRSMEHAQTLLCVSGAMMMIIIGNSLARAFGIAGAAAIIRFRTPVDDPRDTTILFLLMALGMAAGIGALSLAGLGALCLCLLLPFLDRFSDPAPRVMSAEFVARGTTFPSTYVQEVFARHGVGFETREVSHGEAAKVKYRATMTAAVSLDDLSAELLRHEAIASLSWEASKKS